MDGQEEQKGPARVKVPVKELADKYGSNREVYGFVAGPMGAYVDNIDSMNV